MGICGQGAGSGDVDGWKTKRKLQGRGIPAEGRPGDKVQTMGDEDLTRYQR